MKNVLIIILLMSVASGATAGPLHEKPSGNLSDSATVEHETRHRRYIGFTPVNKSTRIDGVAVGYYAAPQSDETALLEINGLSIDVDPAPIGIVPFMALELLIHLPDRNTRRYIANNRDNGQIDPKDTIVQTCIKGASISVGILAERTTMSGFAFNAICGVEDNMKGIEITGIINYHRVCSGVAIAPVNYITKGKGIQIGLVNHCREGRLVQIGLINTIGKRTTPFINFRLKKPRQGA